MHSDANYDAFLLIAEQPFESEGSASKKEFIYDRDPRKEMIKK